MRRRRLEVTSPKSVLVLGHLSPGRLRCGRLRGYPPSAGPVSPGETPPSSLAVRSATPNPLTACPFPPVLSQPGSDRTGPSRAAQTRSLTMASLFKKKTVDGEFRPGQRGPALRFPGVFWGLPATVLSAVPGGGAGSSGPTGDRPRASLLCFPISADSPHLILT